MIISESDGTPTLEDRTLSAALISDHNDLRKRDVFANIAFEKTIDLVE